MANIYLPLDEMDPDRRLKKLREINLFLYRRRHSELEDLLTIKGPSREIGL